MGNRKRFKEREIRTVNDGRGKCVVHSASLKGQTQKERENEKGSDMMCKFGRVDAKGKKKKMGPRM